MIRDHVYRPLASTNGIADSAAVCGFMNCRRPRTEHARVVGGGR